MDYLGKDIPKLGFGLMRLLMLGEEIDIERTKTFDDFGIWDFVLEQRVL